jgi:hypothetical protein
LKFEDFFPTLVRIALKQLIPISLFFREITRNCMIYCSIKFIWTRTLLCGRVISLYLKLFRKRKKFSIYTYSPWLIFRGTGLNERTEGFYIIIIIIIIIIS